MFTLAISCLATSNLPWFMDLTFQVPMQYCSLKNRTLLLSPVTSTTGYCFCFGSLPSFFLELFLYGSPVAYWHLPTWGAPLSVSYHFAFSYYSWGSQGKNTGLPFPSPVDHVLSDKESLRRNGVAISWSTKESEMQYLDAISKTTEWSLFVSKANHSISQ